MNVPSEEQGPYRLGTALAACLCPSKCTALPDITHAGRVLQTATAETTVHQMSHSPQPTLRDHVMLTHWCYRPQRYVQHSAVRCETTATADHPGYPLHSRTQLEPQDYAQQAPDTSQSAVWTASRVPDGVMCWQPVNLHHGTMLSAVSRSARALSSCCLQL
jgi:hypothetical protein